MRGRRHCTLIISKTKYAKLWLCSKAAGERIYCGFLDALKLKGLGKLGPCSVSLKSEKSSGFPFVEYSIKFCYSGMIIVK